MKGGDWMQSNSPIASSWTLKKIRKVKETFRVLMTHATYSIHQVYKELIGTNPRVLWATSV